MLDLQDVFYFVKVIDRGGFTAAAASLGLPKSKLSHRVQELENHLGVRLINRTSRQFSMTDIGSEFYQSALALLNSADLTEQTVKQRLAEPSGVVRITTAVEIAQFAVRELLPKFLNRYPKVRLVQISTDRLVDIVGDGFDLAIRGHSAPLQDSGLVQRFITEVPWTLFASGRYVQAHGRPQQLQDVAHHAILSTARGGTQWQLRGPEDAVVTVPFVPRFQSNDLITLKEAACADLGIAALPAYICRQELSSGDLVPILPGWKAADARMTALMPYRTGLLPAVRALADFLVAEIPRVTGGDETLPA